MFQFALLALTGINLRLDHGKQSFSLGKGCSQLELNFLRTVEKTSYAHNFQRASTVKTAEIRQKNGENRDVELPKLSGVIAVSGLILF